MILRTFDCPDGADVEFYIIEGGGHSWPGSEFSKSIESIVGPTTFDIDATDLIWTFFQAVPPAVVSEAEERRAPRRRVLAAPCPRSWWSSSRSSAPSARASRAEMRDAERGHRRGRRGHASRSRVERIRLGHGHRDHPGRLDRDLGRADRAPRPAGRPRRAARGSVRPPARPQRRAGRAGRRRPELHVLSLAATKQCLIGVQRAIEQASVDDNRGALRTLDAVRTACDRARAAGRAILTGRFAPSPTGPLHLGQPADRAAGVAVRAVGRLGGSSCGSRISTRWRPARST